MIITGQTESQVFLSRTQILKSGWRNGQIKQWLDPPDQEFFADGSVVKLYDAARVEAVGSLRKQNKPSDREERAMCRIAEKKKTGKKEEDQDEEESSATLPIVTEVTVIPKSWEDWRTRYPTQPDSKKKRKDRPEKFTEDAFWPTELTFLQFPKGHPLYPKARFVKRWEPDWMNDYTKPVPVKPKRKGTAILPPHSRGTKAKDTAAEQLRQ